MNDKQVIKLCKKFNILNYIINDDHSIDVHKMKSFFLDEFIKEYFTPIDRNLKLKELGI